MTYAEMVAEAMKRSKPVQDDTHEKMRMLDAAAIIARDQVRQLDYAFQLVRDDDGIPPEVEYTRRTLLD